MEVLHSRDDCTKSHTVICMRKTIICMRKYALSLLDRGGAVADCEKMKGLKHWSIGLIAVDEPHRTGQRLLI